MDQFRIYAMDRGTLIPADLARSLFALPVRALTVCHRSHALLVYRWDLRKYHVHLELSYHFVSHKFLVLKSLSGGGPIRVGRCIIAFARSSCGHLVQNQTTLVINHIHEVS